MDIKFSVKLPIRRSLSAYIRREGLVGGRSPSRSAIILINVGFNRRRRLAVDAVRAPLFCGIGSDTIGRYRANRRWRAVRAASIKTGPRASPFAVRRSPFAVRRRRFAFRANVPIFAGT